MSGPQGADVGGAPRLGSMFGRYRIESVVGRGGMGVVMRATDVELDRVVALKFLAPELRDVPEMRERFMREPRLAAAIEHPNIVPIHEAGVTEGVPFIAMRAIPGPDLATVLRREAPLEAARTLAILRQLADALDAAHRQGLIHRDVKPGNVLVEPGDHDRPERAWLTDFGLTRRLGERSVATSLGPAGTIDYLAPELITGGPVSAATDQYALACLAVHCLTGSPPWDGPTDAAVMHGHLAGDRQALLARIPDVAMRAALAPGLSVDPADRYASCRALVRAMAAEEPRATETSRASIATRATTDPSAASAGDSRPPSRVGPKRAVIVVAVGLILIAMTGALALVLGRPNADSSDTGAKPSRSPSAGPSATVRRRSAPGSDGVIVYAGGNGEQLGIYAVDPVTEAVGCIVDGPGKEDFPVVTPDGAWVIFSEGPEGSRDLWIVRADGTDARQLTSDPGDDYAPALSRTGTRLAWTSTRDGDADILLMTATGYAFREKDAENLTGRAGLNGEGTDVHPAWSRGDQWIVFSSNRSGISSDIWRLDPDRPATVEPVHVDTEQWADGGPTVDGDDRIWFVGSRGHFDRELYDIAMGGAPVRRTHLGDQVIAPDVGPDGVRLVAAVGLVNSAVDAVDTRLMILGPGPDGDTDYVRKDVFDDEMLVATNPDWAPGLEGFPGSSPAPCPAP